MTEDLGRGYKYKRKTIKYPNGDIYEGMCTSYYDNGFEPYGEGVYHNKKSGVSFKANWSYRKGPDFKTIEIINKKDDKPFVIVEAYAGEIYSDLVCLSIIEVEAKTYVFKDLECIVLEPHAWSKHLFTIKKFDDKELVFDFTGPKVDETKFVGCVVNKGEPKELSSTVASHIIWDHDDEYDVSQTSSIKVLYF